ncbi:helix-turn-helix domain-containing protein [Desulfosporosinus youngiae]|uniref:Putative transcriptional regulator with C-terminal CBS domains n=1 Tax=Desulfosporosinus youngiae DSM 17734 TaxID=768710 RepID=H5XWY7_9FIRM|nr:helix-turn-helix transcriptional regulator [Desulfosporosinus youngiae]EHQ90855.1 putative transcriptional regulator with C-terminal CBS domains [Desulfosporosinus youngiae DSM 17734]
MSKTIQEVAGKNIRLFRQAKGLTQEKLAELVNVSSSYIGYLERGLRSPSLDLLARIGTALEVEPTALLFSTSDDFDPTLKKLNALLAGKNSKSINFVYEVARAYFVSTSESV